MLTTLMRRLAAAAIAASTVVIAAAPAEAATTADCSTPVRQFGVTGNDSPFGISAGPGGTWFARGDSIDLIPTGATSRSDVVRHVLPEGTDAVAGWVATQRTSANALVWFATRGTGRLGTITLGGTIHEYQIPDGADGTATPQSIVFGADRSVFFTDQFNDRIGRYDVAAHNFTFWAIPTDDAQPVGMTAGPDGDLYFAERGVAKIGRLDPSTGLFTEWTLPAGSFPNRFAVTPDGNVWFTALNAEDLGYIDPSGHLHLVPVSGGPVGLTYHDGSLWSALAFDGELAQFDLTGHLVHTWALPGAREVLQVAASDGYLWVTDGFGWLVYRVDVGC